MKTPPSILAMPPLPRPRAARPRMSRVGKLFLAVLLIVVFEGALRKWVSSSFTMPLVALRDLLALYLVAYGIGQGLVSRHAAGFKLLVVWSLFLLGWGLLQAMFQRMPPTVLLIGLRFWLLYFWFGYVAGMAMTREDYRRSALAMVWLLVLMTPLVMLQRSMPPGSFLNAQIDTDERFIFIVIPGVVRPTATFSFTLGYTTFLAMALPLALSIMRIAGTGRKMRLLFLAGFVSLLIGSIMSGSRAATIGNGIMLAAYLLGSLWFSRGRARLMSMVSLVLTVALVALAGVVFFEAIQQMQERFTTAAEVEDMATRIFVIFAGEPETYTNFDWLGHGLGAGSNLVGFFMSGERSFALAESEAGRSVLEGGLAGLLFIMVKLGVIAYGLIRAFRRCRLDRCPDALLVWLTLALALLTWSAIGQLSVNPLTGILVAFGVLVLRHPSLAAERRRQNPRQPRSALAPRSPRRPPRPLPPSPLRPSTP